MRVETGVRRGHPSYASQGFVAMRHLVMTPASAWILLQSKSQRIGREGKLLGQVGEYC